MNKYIRALIDLPTATYKILILKLSHGRNFGFSQPIFMSPFSEITLDKGGKMTIGKKFRQRSASRIRVRKSADLVIGNDISLNHGCMIVSRESIIIGDGVQFGPNVLLYDHDHDYKAIGGISAGKYKTQPIEIGDNVWLGAGAIILKGSKIGANSVVAAGSIIRGEFPNNSLVYQTKETKVR
ncbi:acyltransferase [Lactococcus lactis]|uniref:acyltransferase n=1 Tax=Lactococcus lactis TaxID=1358 RepID=UPI003DA99F37